MAFEDAVHISAYFADPDTVHPPGAMYYYGPDEYYGPVDQFFLKAARKDFTVYDRKGRRIGPNASTSSQPPRKPRKKNWNMILRNRKAAILAKRKNKKTNKNGGKGGQTANSGSHANQLMVNAGNSGAPAAASSSSMRNGGSNTSTGNHGTGANANQSMANNGASTTASTSTMQP